jgi:hypothetical protein
VRFTTLAGLANELQEAGSRRELARVVARYARIELPDQRFGDQARRPTAIRSAGRISKRKPHSRSQAVST